MRGQARAAQGSARDAVDANELRRPTQAPPTAPRNSAEKTGGYQTGRLGKGAPPAAAVTRSTTQVPLNGKRRCPQLPATPQKRCTVRCMPNSAAQPDRVGRRRLAAETRAAAKHGAPITEIRVASGTSLFRCAEVAIRVAEPGRSAIDSTDLVALAELYAAQGVPVPKPQAPAARTRDGDELTVWEYVENDSTAPFPYRRVGQILRLLHSIPLAEAEHTLGRPPPHLPEAVSGWIAGRMAVLTAGSGRYGLTPGELESMALRAAAGALAASSREPQTLLHGDVSPGNVLHGRGDVRLCDFEACTRGPWVWDLVNTQIQVATGQTPQSSMREIVEGYAADPYASAAWGPLCLLRALDITTFTMHEALLGSDAGSDACEWATWMRAGFPGLASRYPASPGSVAGALSPASPLGQM
jgi:aminoglycoside phosphotransferase (APT) family kinase protein